MEVVTPTAGGLTRETTQPGTLMAFESAELYAKISGFLETQTVDIGSKVKKDDVLAVIFDPEAHKAVDLASAQLKHSEATVESVRARIATAKAGIDAAQAALVKSQADVKHFVAELVYRKSELNRIIRLVEQGAVEKKLEDEERERHNSAVAAKDAADAQVLSARAELASAQAKFEEAQADLNEAQSVVAVNQAQLENAEILARYTQIKSAYDGVITERNFFPGAFIRSAAEGGNIPLLAVARIDKLRVVVKVPDRDVPYVDVGDPAEIHIDAIPGQVFKGTVSRFADSEDVGDRTMRTEIDLENTDGRLREGMYGGVTILLKQAEPNSMTIPAKALIEQDGKGSGSVFVVESGKVRKKAVKIGADDGVHVEVITGLSANEQVVVNYNGSIADGLAVKTEAAKLEKPIGSSDH